MNASTHTTQALPEAINIRLHTIDEFDWLLSKAIKLEEISQFDTHIESEYIEKFPDSDYALKLLTICRFGYLIESGEGKYRIRWLAFDRINRRMEDVKTSPQLKLVPIW